MSRPFEHPFQYWVGMDTDPRTTAEALAEFNRFYDSTHVHEVIAAHPGFVGVSRYELAEQDPREGELQHHGPRWLAMYDIQDEAAAEQYVKDNARPWLHRRKYSPWPSARRKAKTLWRMIWQVRQALDGSTDRLWLVGTNVAPRAGAPGLELYRSFAHPEPGCPRFCGLAEDAAAEEDPVWRLCYQRIL